jgi:type IV secretory pathway VirB4 component
MSDDISKDDVKKAINEVFQGAEGLNKAKEMLTELQDKLQNFQGNFLKNDAIKQAKVKHKGALAGVLLEVLNKYPKANLSKEEDRVKIAKDFVESYDKEIMSVIGM